MKKVLSMILVLCLVASSCVLFSSCSKVSTKDIEKNPQEVLSEALEKTGAQFFTDDAGLKAFTAAAMKAGSISISFESATVKDELGLGKVTETIYFNEEHKKAVLDTAVNFQDKDLTARIFVDEKGLLINSESVLGNANTYAIYPETLASEFKNSALAGMMGATDEEALAALQEALDALAKAYKDAYEQDQKTAEENTKALLATLNQTVTSEKVETADGKSAKVVVATYTLNNTTLKAYFDKTWEILGVTNADLKAQFDASVAEMLDQVDMNLTAKLSINAKSSELESFDITGTASDKGENPETVTLNANMTFTEEKIALVVSAKAGEEEVLHLNVDILREEKDGVVTYTLTMNTTNEGVTVELLKGSYAYTKKSGDFTVTVKISELDDKGSSEELLLTGNIKKEKDTATIAFNSVKMGDVTVNFDLTITINKKAEMPEAPAEVKDVVKLTKEDLQKLVADFQQSELGKLIFGFDQIMPF